MELTQLAEQLNINLVGVMELEVKFKEISRVFTIGTFTPKVETLAKEIYLVRSQYCNSWGEVFVSGSYIKENEQAHYEMVLSLYLKGCRIGVFPCEADGHFGQILYNSDPEDTILIYPKVIMPRIG